MATALTGLDAPHAAPVTARTDDIESYVRWHHRGGTLCVSVPFPAGASSRRRRSFRVEDDMSPEDALEHARNLQRAWSKRSMEMRAKCVPHERAARMRAPDEDGLLGSIQFRRPKHMLYVMYVDAAGHRAERVFPLPTNIRAEPDRVRAVKEEALQFVRDMLARGVETPIRRKYAGIVTAHKAHPITAYFTPVQRAAETNKFM